VEPRKSEDVEKNVSVSIQSKPLEVYRMSAPGTGSFVEDDEDLRYVGLDECQWDFFLSYEDPAAKAIQVLKEALPKRFLTTSVWLDLEQDASEAGVKHGISFSRNVVAFLTTGSTECPGWQSHMRSALALQKNIVLLGETDENNGKPSIDTLIARCPEDLKGIFNDHVIIPYFADTDFMQVTFDKMARVLAEDSLTIQDTTSSRNKGHELRYNNHESHADAVVMHDFFVHFAGICGMALPGSKRRLRRWARFCKWALVACMLLCILRFFLPEGPAFLDHLGVAQIVATHPLVLVMGSVVQSILRSPSMDDILENHIMAPSEAARLRKRIRNLTIGGATLTVLLTVAGWIAYLPGFFSMYYLDGGSDLLIAYGVIHMIHGAAFLLTLPLVLGWFFCSLIIMCVIQELHIMGLVSAYNELHPEIMHRGLETVATTPAAMNVKETDIFRFEQRYLAAWELHRRVQFQLAKIHYLFWAFQVGFLCWSLWSLGQGVEALPASDERVLRVKEHWSLAVRVAWFFAASPWFGVASYLLGLMPFSAILYAWRLRQLSQRLFFTLPELRITFQAFLQDLELEYRVLLLQASPKLFLAYVPILLANTLGFTADATRLFRAAL